MITATRHIERHQEDVSRTHAQARDRNKSGRLEHDAEMADHEDSLAERMDDSLFGDIGQTETQEMLHDFGGGLSKGPPRGGWPVFDPVTGNRLDSPTALSVITPNPNGIR